MTAEPNVVPSDQVHPTPAWARASKSLLLPAFWVIAVLTVFGALRLGGFVRESFAAFPIATTTAIVLFTLYAVPFCVFVAALDYLEREPPLLLATAFAWGGLVATTISIRGNAAVHNLVAKLGSPGFAAEWGSALAGPTVEEIAKTLGIIAIVLVARAQVNSVLDGVVYGSLVGLGFQVVEDIVYAVNAVAMAGRGDQVEPVIATFLLRGFLAGLWSHTMFGALAGAGIGYLTVRTDRPMWRRIGVAALAVVGAMVFHFLWNSPLLGDGFGGGLGLFVGLFLKGVPPLLMILLLVRGVRHREAEYYTEQLAALGDPRIATIEELRALRQGHLRASARRYAYGRAGIRGRRAVRRLQKAQARLAVELSRSTEGGGLVYDGVMPGYASADGTPGVALADPPTGMAGSAPAAVEVAGSAPAVVGVASVRPAGVLPTPVGGIAYAPVLGGPAAVRWRDQALVERGRLVALGHPEALAPLDRHGDVRRIAGGFGAFLLALVAVWAAIVALGAS